VSRSRGSIDAPLRDGALAKVWIAIDAAVDGRVAARIAGYFVRLLATS
jgi:hypothetical protein